MEVSGKVPDWLATGDVSFLRPYAAEEMEAYTVRPMVNSPKNNGPELIEPAVDEPAGDQPLPKGLFDG